MVAAVAAVAVVAAAAAVGVGDPVAAQKKRGLLLQWHITERCNLRCRHCYQGPQAAAEMTLDGLLGVLHQYRELLAGWRLGPGGEPTRGHITITGGEPLVRRDFFELLELLATQHEKYSFAILTNGTLIDDAVARRLRKLGPSYVQVSIDGNEQTHDHIRGKGSYVRTSNAIRHLVRHGVRTFISFTAHRSNYTEFPEVARLGQRLGVARVWADRLIPCGAGAELQSLTPTETAELFGLMERARRRAARSWRGCTEISMHRALQFLAGGGRPYRCTAGDTLLTVMPNGDLYPCRRMPILVGNLAEQNLSQLYYDSPLLRARRDPESIPKDCGGCFYARLCRGGLRCLSHAVSGSLRRADPGCWRAASCSPPGVAQEPGLASG